MSGKLVSYSSQPVPGIDGVSISLDDDVAPSRPGANRPGVKHALPLRVGYNPQTEVAGDADRVVAAAVVSNNDFVFAAVVLIPQGLEAARNFSSLRVGITTLIIA